MPLKSHMVARKKAIYNTDLLPHMEMGNIFKIYEADTAIILQNKDFITEYVSVVL